MGKTFFFFREELEFRKTEWKERPTLSGKGKGRHMQEKSHLSEG